MNRDVTIIIPTRNRPLFLNRLLNFFACMKLDSPIIIADSSDDAVRPQMEAAIEQQPELHIQHMASDLPITEKCIRAFESVTTPYCVMCADDDFVMPDSVHQCVEFLDANPDYSCAAGIWIQVESLRDNRCSQVRCDQLDHPDPRVRFRRYAQNWFSNFYAVGRTDNLLRAWRIMQLASDHEKARIYPEWMLSQLAVIYGKFAVLPQTHYLFELHGENISSHQPLIADAASANLLYDQFEAGLANELARVGSVSLDEAVQTVRGCYGKYRTGSEMTRDHRPKGWRRYSDKLRKQIAYLADKFSNNPTKVRVIKRLQPNHSAFQGQAWQLAYRLTQEFPAGMELEDQSHENSQASSKSVAA